MDMPVTTACIIPARGRRLGVSENHQKMSVPTVPANDGSANTNERKARIEAAVVTMWVCGSDAALEGRGRT
jgi:hypothetical protein